MLTGKCFQAFYQYTGEKDLWNNEESPLQLKVILPNNVTLSIFLHGNGPWIMGSAPDCDLPVKAKGVSRKHLEFLRTDGSLRFKDLDSTNGTKLNGERAREGELAKESILQIGDALVKIGGTDTDNLRPQGAEPDLCLDSYMDIIWDGANIPSGEPSKKLVNFEFMIGQVEKFLSGVAPIEAAASYANFMMELLQCRGVRLYHGLEDENILFAEAGDFPSEKLKPGQLEIMLSTGRISGFVFRDKTEPLYFLCFPIRLDREMRVVFIGVMPYFQNIMLQNQDVIPSFYIQSRLLGQWSWEITKKQALLSDLQKKLDSVEKEISTSPDTPELIIGQNQKLLKEIETADRFAPTDTPVLIFGATGTGKELMARRIHKKSHRSGSQFVALNCASIPENLLESELFGVERGAYTGADKSRNGYFEKANGGTLFLDEIGDLPLSLQPKLLRVIQEKQFSPLGSTKIVTTDVRLIAATNQDLFSAVGTGRFRQDLFYRLTEGIPIHLPPLAERGDDILLLANYFVNIANREFKKHVTGFEDKAVDVLKRFHWPGNVRQMQSLVKHMVLLCNDNVISEKLAEESIMRHRVSEDSRAGLPFWTLPIGEAKEAFEKEYLSRRLEIHKGSISALAKELGIARPNLYIKMKRWGLAKK